MRENPLVASLMLPSGDLALNLGMCPNWESNQQPFGPQAGAQSTEPHQPGQIAFSLKAASNIIYFVV